MINEGEYLICRWMLGQMENCENQAKRGDIEIGRWFAGSSPSGILNPEIIDEIEREWNKTKKCFRLDVKEYEDAHKPKEDEQRPAIAVVAEMLRVPANDEITKMVEEIGDRKVMAMLVSAVNNISKKMDEPNGQDDQ